MRLIVLLEAALISALQLCGQDAREIVRKSVELDQANWLRMQNYTWVARNTERHLDSKGQTKSVESTAWETLVLSGQPHRRIIERDGKPLPPDEQSEEHTSELQSPVHLVCRLLLEKKKHHPCSHGRARSYQRKQKSSQTLPQL